MTLNCPPAQPSQQMEQRRPRSAIPGTQPAGRSPLMAEPPRLDARVAAPPPTNTITLSAPAKSSPGVAPSQSPSPPGRRQPWLLALLSLPTLRYLRVNRGLPGFFQQCPEPEVGLEIRSRRRPPEEDGWTERRGGLGVGGGVIRGAAARGGAPGR
ncbi:Os09g0555175 [Oryza sativa Japonica Group]|uniref:Os09g0555175 protein n=1 Tax=Oryza sativa subsp. japonica TaxID=39947 RepID=A0A0P0XQ55_ORYSJ|nr:Os09g0555175 [Oryza sativa Japonica Group]